ncbi:MAG: hypothetical protein WCC36_16445, partial [Gammaproteobacteria bacterium]
ALQTAGFRGQDVRVGIIAQGARNLHVLTDAGVLPAKVATLGSRAGSGDLGDRMMQVVHGIAPQAALAFCAAANPRQTVACATALITRFHAQIVVDDINPAPVRFWPGSKALGYRRLHARFPSVLFFTGAGSEGRGYYQAPYVSTMVEVGHSHYTAQDFGHSVGPGNDPYNDFLLPAGATAKVLLGWNDDPDQNPSTDACAPANNEISLVLVSGPGDVVASDQGPCPLEQVTYTNQGRKPQRLRIVILLNAPTDTSHLRFKLVALNPAGAGSSWRLRYATAGAAGISATVAGVTAVSAVDPHTGYRGHYLLEDSANAGPQCQDYDKAGGRNRRLPRPRCWQQPALVVPDRAMVQFSAPAPPGYHPAAFQGDAAAASGAAGAAALLLSAKIQPGDITTLLSTSAVPQVSKPGWDPRYGWGLLDVHAAAIRAHVLKAAPDRTPPVTPPTRLRTGEQIRHWRALAHKADHGDGKALGALEQGAQHSLGAQTWLGIHYARIGKLDTAAYWYRRAAEGGEPLAQTLLGSLFDRGSALPEDARAAYAWWRRAARSGLPEGLYDLGKAYVSGRGTPAEPQVGYALLLAARERGYRPADAAIAQGKRLLRRDQIHRAEILARRFVRDPGAIP